MLTTDEPRVTYTVAEVAAMLRRSVASVITAIKQGDIRGRKVAASITFLSRGSTAGISMGKEVSMVWR